MWDFRQFLAGLMALSLSACYGSEPTDPGAYRAESPSDAPGAEPDSYGADHRNPWGDSGGPSGGGPPPYYSGGGSSATVAAHIGGFPFPAILGCGLWVEGTQPGYSEPVVFRHETFDPQRTGTAELYLDGFPPGLYRVHCGWFETCNPGYTRGCEPDAGGQSHYAAHIEGHHDFNPPLELDHHGPGSPPPPPPPPPPGYPPPGDYPDSDQPFDPSGSCQNNCCGEVFTGNGTCFCDADCFLEGDCCHDVVTSCGGVRDLRRYCGF